MAFTPPPVSSINADTAMTADRVFHDGRDITDVVDLWNLPQLLAESAASGGQGGEPFTLASLQQLFARLNERRSLQVNVALVRDQYERQRQTRLV